MVIVRESPGKTARKEDQQWPPRSPYEALLSSPSGRRKYQQRLEGRKSPTPSPSKRSRTERDGTGASLKVASEDEEEEDEETVELRLAAIEARLKLKKIRDAKAKQNKALDGDVLRSAVVKALQGERPESRILVPTSPVRDRRAVEEPKSPARVVLGIDKGVRATEISLKRAVSRSRTLSRADSLRKDGRTSTPHGADAAPRPKTFSERLTARRASDKEVQGKENRIKQSRSTSFGAVMAQIQGSVNGHSKSAQLSPTKRSQAPLQQASSVSSKDVPKGNPKPTSAAPTASPEGNSIRRSASLSARHRSAREPDVSSQKPQDDEPEDVDVLEPYSGIYLSKRLIDHDTLTRTFQGKELYNLPRLLREIKSPHYDPPDCETDYIILGIIAYKSTPRDQKVGKLSISTSGEAEDEARPKFMHLRLTDLKWDIDLFLFDSGFERFWKLVPGTVIALLNPGIMPPRNKDKGDFSLKLTSSEDTVIEIGKARDMGFCSAKKADGTDCTSWIDTRKTGVCDYHMNLEIEKTRRGRMEVNGMFGLGGAGKGSWRGGRKKDDGLTREGKYHDKELHETLWIAPKEFSRPTSSLIDGDNDYNAFERGMSKEELKRRREKEQKKENELAKKLSLKGSGAGSEYLKARIDSSITSTSASYTSTTLSSDFLDPPDPKALGLLNNRASDVHLSPVKGRTKIGAFRQEPMGWGGACKRGLPSPRKGLAGMRDSSLGKRDTQRSPSPKKARFMIENKGIREPGRESLSGNVQLSGGDIFLDDDDDLDIIK